MVDTAGTAVVDKDKKGLFTGKPGKALILIIFAVLLSLVINGCSANTAGNKPPSGQGKVIFKEPLNGVTQSSTVGEVTLSAEWLGIEDNKLLFFIVMDTHSVNLDGYDLSKLVVIRDDSGKEYKPVSWVARAGAHHRSGTLKVPLPSSVEQEKARYVQLIIRNIAGVSESILQWNLV